MLLPIAALAAAIAWLTWPALLERMQGEDDQQATPLTSASEPESMHHGFQAELVGIGRVQLAPLYAVVARQEFDAQAFGRLLGGAEGMPWRLRLEGTTTEHHQPLDPDNLRVVEGDAVWIPFPAQRLAADSPLAALLAPPKVAATGPLDIILWGPRSCSAPRLELVAESTSTPLEAASWVAQGEDEALLRLEPLR